MLCVSMLKKYYFGHDPFALRAEMSFFAKARVR